MSFVPNDGNQISFDDRASSLTEREKKLLEKSWAKKFSEIVFPKIFLISFFSIWINIT